ncbi:nad-dependent aldehyde dehydrogenase [Trichoderma arundinaceum]|uniref:Nad-dependent aldehyde dehydrogenase n=1 Tax=Trichoderma arundinaceum TaxID=490622 RepID=A0A395NYL9_TRIAR|nr:nad-dependent aldehyde dehydrogenase [Trichoderma arundinaceum]
MNSFLAPLRSITRQIKSHPIRTNRRAISTGTVIPLIINGQDVQSQTTFETVSPLTGKASRTCSSASLKHVEIAIQAAHAAFPAWSKTKYSDRRDLLLQAADIMTKRKIKLGEYMHEEIGANEAYQDFIIGLAVDGLKDVAGRIAVCLGIAPWNAPYHLGLRSITFALATGNTTILKGSELSPLCYWGIADVFREAGLPNGCLNLIFHRTDDAASVTESLIAHPSVKKINFTGSSQVGSIVAATAGRHLKPCLMELGGKANAIVLKDADLRKAAVQCAMGAFMNVSTNLQTPTLTVLSLTNESCEKAGQICMSTERILVDSTIASEFEGIFKETINDIFGTAETTPILVSAASANRNANLINDAVEKGANIFPIFQNDIQLATETRMRPVVLTHVNQSMNIYGGESFGPSVSLYTFNTEAEAIELANDTNYGLSASIFTQNLHTAFRIAEGLESGAVHINSMTVHDEYQLPHGGVKQSGWGRFNEYQGLEEFLYSKTVTWMDS